MTSQSYSTIFRIEKRRTWPDIEATGNHNTREKMPPNADPVRTPLNRILIGEGKTPAEAIHQRLLDCGIVPRKNAVLALEVLATAGLPFFTAKNLDPWIAKTLALTELKVGKGNLVHAALHLDESTPHLQMFATPILAAHDHDGPKYKRLKKRIWKLDCKGLLESMAHLRLKNEAGLPIGHPTAPFLHSCQKEYFDLCEALDPQISAPLFRSRIEHQSLARWNAARLKAEKSVTPEKIELRIEPPTALEEKMPEFYLQKEALRLTAVAQQILEPLRVKAQQTDQLLRENEALKATIREVNNTHELEIKGVQAEIEKIKSESQLLKDKLRDIPLVDVMAKFEHQGIPTETSIIRYHLPDDRVIDVAGCEFFECKSQVGPDKQARTGFGATELAQFLTGWDLATARRWLTAKFGAARTLANELAQAERIMEEEVQPILQTPTTPDETKTFAEAERQVHLRDDRQWHKARTYLLQECALSAGLVDSLYATGMVWANFHGALVFPTWDTQQNVQGMAIVGTTLNSVTGQPFQGEVGSREYCFQLKSSPTVNHMVLLDSPLDALSYFDLFPQQATIIFTGRRASFELLNKTGVRAASAGLRVLLAFSQDASGHLNSRAAKQALQALGVQTEIHRPPKPNKCWNDLLKAQRIPFKKINSESEKSLKLESENPKSHDGNPDAQAR